jgi:asparagine synthase (glutamine-hydrolysing)
VIHPFLDARFLGAVARAGGRVGFGERTRAMRSLFGEPLPAALLERSTKASFNEVF